MPKVRFQRIWEREGGRRARHSFLPALIAFVLLLVGACGGNDKSLNTPQVSDTTAPTVSPEPATQAPEQTMGDAQSDALAPSSVETSDTGITLKASVADNADDACVGAKEITVEPDALLFFCVEVANQGRIPLTDVEILSTDQRLSIGSFIVAEGDFANIDPEGFLIAALVEPVVDGKLAGQVANDGLEVWLEANAVPVGPGGVELEKILANSRILVQVQEDGSTSFTAAVGAGADTLLSIASRFPLVAGFVVLLLPFLALILWFGWWCRRRLRSGHYPHSPA